MKHELTIKAFYLGIVLIFLFPFYAVTNAFAEGENESASGCQSVAVDPEASLEMQQAICGAAEQDPASSCASAGLGMCSSPKTNDTMVDGTNCICLSESDGELYPESDGGISE